MVGLIWTIQIVHYPLFNRVGEQHFTDYQERHQFQISLIVGPMMLTEAVSAALLAGYPPASVEYWMPIAGLILLIVTWVSTSAIQVPCHSRLVQGFNEAAYRRLVYSNWIRTVAWTARGALLVWMLWIVLLSSLGQA